MEYNTNELRIKYPGLKKTLQYLIVQSAISVDYCQNRFGTNNDLQKIWNIGNQNLIYEHDINNIEQIQSVGTLFENNIHGKPGAGDCDCFTVFGVAMLAANNYKLDRTKIVLQGNKAASPSHVLFLYDDKIFDFTEPTWGSIRDYKFYQILDI
jgi:hypothetical protein